MKRRLDQVSVSPARWPHLELPRFDFGFFAFYFGGVHRHEQPESGGESVGITDQMVS